jgi:CRP/FNR family transcriptional activator FtrB
MMWVVDEGDLTRQRLIIIKPRPQGARNHKGSCSMRSEEKPEIASLPLFCEMNEAERERIFSASFLQVFRPS